MKLIITTLSALVIAATISTAEAKPGKGGKGGDRPNPEERFKKLDTNNDGTISLDEFKAGPRGQRNPDRAAEAFKRIDKNDDGKLTLEEIKEGHGKCGKGGRGGNRKGAAA